MTTEIATTDTAELARQAETVERARQLIEDATPENTLRARSGALRYFWSWADVALDLAESYPVAPGVLLQFVTDHLTGLDEETDRRLHEMTWEDDLGRVQRIKARLGVHSIATVSARVSHIAAAHAAQGLDSPSSDPVVVEALKAGRKLRARNGGQKAKQAATLDTLDAMLRTCDDSPAGLRDAALLLTAFASGGRRRSEVAAIQAEDLETVQRQIHGHPSSHAVDYVLTLRHSKADQEGEGLSLPIAGRAADVLRRWIDFAEISEGPIFRGISKGGKINGKAITGRTVARIVKARAELAGLDPRAFAGHSLRSGFVSECGRRGISLQETMSLTGHKTPSVAARYHRPGAVLHSAAARIAG
ncbi:MAG: site-specific integrase [Acidobacteriota bacterium]